MLGQTENEQQFMQSEDSKTPSVLKEEGKRICLVKRAFKEMLASKRYLQFQRQYKNRMFDIEIRKLAYEKKIRLAEEESFEKKETENHSIEKWQQKLEQLRQLQEQLEREKTKHAINPYVSKELKQNLDELSYINSPESVNAAYQLGESLHSLEEEITKKEMEYSGFVVGKKRTEEVEKVSQIYQGHEQYIEDEVICNLKIQRNGILKKIDTDLKRISQLKLQTSVPYVLASGVRNIVSSAIKDIKNIGHSVLLPSDPTYQYALQLFNKSYMTFLKDDIAFEQFISLLKAFSKSADDENEKTK